MPKIHNILFAVLAVIYLNASGQDQQINFTSITSKDGLLSNSISAILKDRQGLMWFATDDGLYKFDGTNFTIYRNRPGDSGSLRANEILALHEDAKGNLWVGTSGGGFSLFNRRQDIFLHYPTVSNVPGLTRNAVVRGICSDSDGKIWIAQFQGLYVLDPVTNHISKLELTSGKNGAVIKTTLISLFIDSKQRVWVATDAGLFVYTPSSKSFRHFVHNDLDKSSISTNKVRVISEDSAGNIWVGTANGLCRMLENEQGFISYFHVPGNASTLSDNAIHFITPDQEGRLWIGTGNGLSLFNPGKQTFTVYRHENNNIHSLTANIVRSAYIDKKGIYWFGTFRGGINKYDKNINLFGIKPAASFQENIPGSSIISSFAEKNNELVFVGTEGGLFEFNRKNNQVSVYHTELNNKAQPPAILALRKTRNNQLYIGTFAQGVIIMDIATGNLQWLKQGPAANDINCNDIFCITEDSKGFIWVGTNGEGVNVLDKNKVIARYTPASRPHNGTDKLLPINGYIRAIAEDRDGNIWIGSHGAGLAVFHPEKGKWSVYNKDNSQLASDKIQSLLCDSRGNLWVGTFGGGLSLYKKEENKFLTFSEQDGLQNTTIYQMVEDQMGKIWFSTNTGISSLNIASKKFRSFTSYNGVLHSNFTRGSGIRLADGELLFGGQQGFNYFKPSTFTFNRNVPAVLLTDLKVSNKSVAPGNDSPIKEHISVAKEVRLAYKQNFALSFVALNYTIPKQNSYAYKLEGFDKEWIYTGSINTASYTNLDPGEYIFHVKATNNDGIWSEGEALIHIIVRPPLWRTWYAWIFYVVVIAALLLYIRHRGIARLRRQFALEKEREQARRNRELDQMKLKFLTNLSHDFRTPISLIMGPADQLITDGSVEGRIDKLNMIRRNARRLLNLVNQLLDFRKMEEQELKLQPTRGDLIAFLKDVTESFRDLSERKQIVFTFKSDLTRMDTLFDHDKIERVLFNLLSNAFKFTLTGGAIGVEITNERENGTEVKLLSIKVKDTGIGIPVDKQEKIFERFFQNNSTGTVLNQGTGIGLSITKEFIKMHGGEIEVESEPGKGTVFTILLPLRQLTGTVTESKPVVSPARHATETAHPPSSPTSTEPDNKEVTTEAVRILIVEDNEDFRFYLKDNLRNSYKVLEAANGKEGWQKALAHHPQVIISDISMPEMDGIELVKKLKSDSRTSHIPILLLTAITGDEQQIRGLETGANDYITKPFNFEVLSAKIKSLLELKSTLKSAYTKQIKVLTPETPVESTDEKLMQAIVQYLETNLVNPQLSVEGLSKHVGMSRSSLYNKLLQLTGKTPVEYIRSFRLEKAAVLMQKSNMTISEIAYQVGFATPNYFTKAFKSQFNMLPSEYVARMRNEKG